MSQTRHLHLFDGYGIELEYMIVDKASLAVRPISEFVLKEAAGEVVNEVELGETAWSNELVMHVLELKTNGPAPELAKLHETFLRDVQRINGILAAQGAMLMPTAMHPTMDPATEKKLWPHDNNEIYAAYDRIFDCRGHGWSNLQSIHINLPFFDDREFGRLHAAIRLVLPLLPALAASSPIYDGKLSGFMDSRLEFYRHNQRRIPSITGGVIPEQAYSKDEYVAQIFRKIYADISAHDPEKILQDEWLNSRGAIARFDRNAIEIRVLDIQESPRMDLGVITAVVSLVKALCDEVWTDLPAQQAWRADPLREVFLACVRDGSDALIHDEDYLKVFGLAAKEPLPAAQVWRRITGDLLERGGYPLADFAREVDTLVTSGCLAKRIARALGPAPSKDRIKQVYRALCDVLPKGGIFDGAV